MFGWLRSVVPLVEAHDHDVSSFCGLGCSGIWNAVFRLAKASRSFRTAVRLSEPISCENTDENDDVEEVLEVSTDFTKHRANFANRRHHQNTFRRHVVLQRHVSRISQQSICPSPKSGTHAPPAPPFGPLHLSWRPHWDLENAMTRLIVRGACIDLWVENIGAPLKKPCYMALKFSIHTVIEQCTERERNTKGRKCKKKHVLTIPVDATNFAWKCRLSPGVNDLAFGPVEVWCTLKGSKACRSKQRSCKTRQDVIRDLGASGVVYKTLSIGRSGCTRGIWTILGASSLYTECRLIAAACIAVVVVHGVERCGKKAQSGSE